MRKEPMHQAVQIIRQKRRHRVWNRVVAGLAAVVVFSTTYMLIIPAITMEQTAYCGIEAHTHEETCFEKQLVCAVEEAAPHIHSESCYREEQVLICGQNEKPGHVHDESCIQRELVPVCTEDHAHSDACYQTVETYICGLTEGEGAHSHESACYETESVLACGQEENAEGHVHTEACYEAVLICPKEEHEHTLGCFSNPEADVETPAVWEKTVSDIELTGVWADDVLAVAESQLGYEESTHNYTVTENGQKKGYTRYGAWYGDPYGDWCAMFASFCLHYAEVDTELMPMEANCPRWIELLKDREEPLYVEADSGYIPVPGDLIFFDFDPYDAQSKDARDADHVGFVYELEYDDNDVLTKIKTIEGNSSDRVQTVTYDVEDDTILGYGKLPENPEDAAETAEDISTYAADGNPNYVRENVTSVTVTKKWRGLESLRPASVTIHLYQNGEEYEACEPITLSADNNWTYTVEGLPYHDDAGNAYSYTVLEDPVENFYTSYSDISVILDTTAGTHYVQATTLESGKSYFMVSRGYAISAYLDGKDVKASGESVAITSGNVTYDGITYPSEFTDPSDIPSGGQWTVTVNADGTYTFKCGDYYLFHKKDGKLYMAAEAEKPAEDFNTFNIDADGYIWYLDKDNKVCYLNAKTDNHGFKQFEKKDATKKDEASTFAFYEAVEVVGSYDKYACTVTNAYMSGGESGETSVSSGKYIDYLGDGGTNPDTTLTGDYYRQYLDMTADSNSGVDFLFVVDTTGSMDFNLGKDENGKTLQRDDTVSMILNGSTDGTPKESGLLTQVLRANPNNKAAVITFCGQIRNNSATYDQALAAEEARTQLEWCSLSDSSGVAPYANVLHTDGWGTCYAMGVVRAADFMYTDALATDGNRKVVVFLGDGEPNATITSTPGGVAATKEELMNKDDPLTPVFFNWSASDSGKNTKPTVDYLIERAANVLPATQECVDIYSISVGYDTSGENDILGYMAEKGNGQKFVVNSVSDTVSAFREIISNYFPSGAKITDHISQYAELYTEQLDLKVTRVSGGEETVIWQGDAVNSDGTIGSAENGGASYIQSVTYTASSSEDSTGTVEVKFQPSYILEPGVKYVLSYNLKATDQATAYYDENGYPSTGDANTDYPGNATSSEKVGFYSNQSAILSYMKDGGENASQYPHPVIQVKPATTTLTINKTVLGDKTDKQFTFKAVLSVGEFPVPGETDKYTIDDAGAAVFSLGNTESITLTVPANVTVTLTETSHDGYTTVIKCGEDTIADGDTANIEIGTDPVVITVTNTEIPEPEPPTTTLTINKTVLGAETDEKFAFKAVLSDGAFPEPGEGDLYTIDADGSAVFSLADQESITLTIPANVTVTLTETSHDGYISIMKNGPVTLASGDTASIEIGTDPVVIDVTNSTGVELPSTGGSGITLFHVLGSLLVACAAVLLVIKKRLNSTQQ